jgi:hypothetical protein
MLRRLVNWARNEGGGLRGPRVWARQVQDVSCAGCGWQQRSVARGGSSIARTFAQMLEGALNAKTWAEWLAAVLGSPLTSEEKRVRALDQLTAVSESLERVRELPGRGRFGKSLDQGWITERVQSGKERGIHDLEQVCRDARHRERHACRRGWRVNPRGLRRRVRACRTGAQQPAGLPSACSVVNWGRMAPG